MSIQQDNLGGIVGLEILLAENIGACRNVGGSVSVTLLPGKAWEKIAFTYGSAQVSEEPTETEAGELLTQKVSFRIPHVCKENTGMLEQKRNVRMIAKLLTDSGEAIILGSKSHPALLYYKVLPGAAAADYFGYEVMIVAKSTTPLGLLVL